MTILTEQYKIRSVEDSDVSMLPSYLRIDAEIKSKLNKTLFNIGKKLAETGDTSLSKTDLDIKDKVRVSAKNKSFVPNSQVWSKDRQNIVVSLVNYSRL